jgi:hypothetical protein
MTDQGEQESPHALPSRAPKGPPSALTRKEMSTRSNTTAKASLEERVRERAYQLWVEEGRPAGRDRDHWEKARRLIDEEERSGLGPAEAPGPVLSDPLTPAVDPAQKTKTAAKKKRSFKSAKA